MSAPLVAGLVFIVFLVATDLYLSRRRQREALAAFRLIEMERKARGQS